MKTRQVYCPFCKRDTKCGIHNSEAIFEDHNTEEGQYEIIASDREFEQILDELESE